MTESNNQPGNEVADPSAYLTNIIKTLGNRSPLEVFEQTPDQLRRIITDEPIDVLRRRPYPDRWTWTPLEIIGHLLDAEWTIGWRTRAVLCDDEPTLIGMGQDKWADVQRHNDRDPLELVKDFTSLREINIRLWRTIPADQMSRVGHHNERGAESLADIMTLYAGHDLYHLEQIKRYIAAQT